MTTTQLREIDKARSGVKVLLYLIAMGGVLIHAVVLALVAIKLKLYWLLPAAPALLYGGYVLTLKRAFAAKKRSHDLFMSNDIFADTPARQTDALALERFEGNIKKTLHYIMETSDLYRRERRAYMREWEDYERSYVDDYYRQFPDHLSQIFKRDSLTTRHIFETLEAEGVNPADTERYDIIRFPCTAKHYGPDVDGGNDTYSLDFGEFGFYTCEQSVYYEARKGEFFYIVRLWKIGRFRKSSRILCIFPEEEWEPEPRLSAMLIDPTE